MKLKNLGHLLGLTQKPNASSGTSGDSPRATEASAEKITTSSTDVADEVGRTTPPPQAPAVDSSAYPLSPTTTDEVFEEPQPPETQIVDTDVSSSTQPTCDDQQSSTQDPVMDEKSGAISYQEEQLAEGRDQLGAFLNACEGSYGVIVSSIDGNSVIHRVNQDLPIERLANMTSSLLALGETIARESLQCLCRFVILENSDGRVVCLRINQVLMLTCITGKQSNLGMVLNIGQKTSDGLAEIF